LNHQKTTILAAVLLLALFCAVVLFHDHHARKKAHARIASHAGIVANALWNHNQQGAEQYLSLAGRSHNYASITVRDIRGKIFQHSSGEAPANLQRFFTALHLMPRVPLASPVRYDDKVIGTIEAEWHCDTIYFDSILLVVLVMVFAIFQLYRGLVREKKLLENRVVHRTSQLSDVNKHLEQEVQKHKASKQALEKSEERYRAYFEEKSARPWILQYQGRPG